jgi:hypothetical protein
MSGESLVGLVAAFSGLIGAVFTGLIAMRRERREVATLDVLELRAYREAWIWSVRTITSLLSLLGRNDVSEPKNVRREMEEHQERIDNPAVRRADK